MHWFYSPNVHIYQLKCKHLHYLLEYLYIFTTLLLPKCVMNIRLHAVCLVRVLFTYFNKSNKNVLQWVVLYDVLNRIIIFMYVYVFFENIKIMISKNLKNRFSNFFFLHLQSDTKTPLDIIVFLRKLLAGVQLVKLIIYIYI